MRKNLVLKFSGDVKNNPGGPGNWRFIVEDLDNQDVYSTVNGLVGYDERWTVNTIAWQALIEGLKFLVAVDHFLQPDTLTIVGNSEVVLNQITGFYNSKKHKHLYDEARRWLDQIDYGHLSFKYQSDATRATIRVG